MVPSMIGWISEEDACSGAWGEFVGNGHCLIGKSINNQRHKDDQKLVARQVIAERA
jgi:hypothetical protein